MGVQRPSLILCRNSVHQETISFLMHSLSAPKMVMTIVRPDQRANATFVILCRNSDLHGAVKSIRDYRGQIQPKVPISLCFLE
jgi:hypothetical protein